MIELGSVKEGSSLIDELMELTSQSLCQLEIKEHFNIIKEIGRGKYGRVLLVTHRCKGMSARQIRLSLRKPLMLFFKSKCSKFHTFSKTIQFSNFYSLFPFPADLSKTVAYTRNTVAYSIECHDWPIRIKFNPYNRWLLSAFIPL